MQKKVFLRVLCALVIALMAFPLSGFAEEATSTRWADASDEIDRFLDLAFEAYLDGDPDTAYEYVSNAYFRIYETTGFERQTMSYISGNRKNAVEMQFSACKAAVKKENQTKETIISVRSALTKLKTMIREDGNKLAAMQGGVQSETKFYLLGVYSIVFQDVTLFNNSILENIRVGKKEATDEEVLAAARLANCDEFALKLPQGYSTVIGENGSELSGGERQRISIARAFLKDAPIILLDEASASLDVENETVIQEALSRLIRDKTVVVIAHRMRTVSGADKIVVLSDGTIAEEGSPSELLTRKDSAFSRMAGLQNASADWAI